jgi:hypothetical protein
MAINIEEFNSSHLASKAFFISTSTVFLLNLHTQDKIRSLYAIENIYFEVTIDKETRNLLDITAFVTDLKEPDRLDKYFDHIKLPRWAV